MSADAFVAHFAGDPRITKRVGRVTFTDDGCWLYGAGQKHYPRIYGPVGGTYFYLHRVSLAIKLERTVEDLRGKEAAHRCDRPRCVNPDHLFLATHAENMADMGAKGRHRIPNLSGDECPQSALTKDQVVAVLAAHAAGESIHSLARRLPASRRAIGFWVRGTWRRDAYDEFHRLNGPDLDDMRAHLDAENFAAVMQAVAS